MAQEPDKPFKLSPTPLTAGLMLTFAICVDALQFFLGAALTVVVGVGLAVAWMLGLLTYVILWIWFKLADNNSRNHFVLMRILAYYGAMVIELIPGFDFFPAITFGVLSRILISWAGDAKANKLAKEDAEGEELSAGNERRLAARMQYKAAREGIESVEQSRAAYRKQAVQDAGKGKERRDVVRRQGEREREREMNIGKTAVGIVAPEVALPLAASAAALDAYRKSKSKKGPVRTNTPPKGENPYAGDMREAA